MKLTFSKTSKRLCGLSVFVFLFMLLSAAVPEVKSQETAQIYLKFDSASTKSEVRVSVIISSSEPVGAFWAEYGYNSSCLKLKSITSENGGEIYSRDNGGTVNVIYLNDNPNGESYLTLKFSVVQQGSSDVTSYYREVLSKGNAAMEFNNNNDCQISVGDNEVTSSSSSPSKTSSSSSSGGKVSVEKDNSTNKGSSSVSVKPSANSSVAEGELTEDFLTEEFFGFQSENPVFWAVLGAGAACAVMLIIFTSYKMGMKKMKLQQEKTVPEEKKEEKES